MDLSIWLPNLWQATLDTLYMVGAATFFTLLFGMPLGILLVITEKDGLFPAKIFHQGLSLIVNITRSLPFIILMVVVIPFTRAVAGTTIGATAAIVPLSLAAIPFFGRVAETSLREVDHGIVEAAQAMGCSTWQIVFWVMIPEAMPSIVLGITLTIISLLGYSAMAGAIGGGGLGDLAIRYGYQRFETAIMLATVVILVMLVQGIQYAGNKIAQRISR
jgi:D-methionine transport system permease protein